MSDPRIYHRVGPTAPEGRQIYDDIRRRNAALNNTLGGEIETVSDSVSSLDSTVTSLQSQISNLSATPVLVGESITQPATENISSSGTNIRTITVTPTQAKKFVIDVEVNFSTGASKPWQVQLRETTGGTTTTLKTYLDGSVSHQYFDGGINFSVIVDNTATSARTFVLWIKRAGGGVDAVTHYGAIQAFQWTVS